MEKSQRRHGSMCYYKCTYKPCPVKKTVEQYNKDDPPLFLVTYQQEHTCKFAPTTTAHDQLMSHPTPPSQFLLNSACWTNRGQVGETEHYQSNPSINTAVNCEEATATRINAVSSPSILQVTSPCVMTPGSMQIEDRAFGKITPDFVTSWLSMPTSPLLMAPGSLDQIENHVSNNELEGLPSYVETSIPNQSNNIASSLLDLPAPPCPMMSGSMEVESCSFEDFSTDEVGQLAPTLNTETKGATGAPDHSNGMVSSFDQPPSSWFMMEPGFMEMGNQVNDYRFGDGSILFSSIEFGLAESVIMDLVTYQKEHTCGLARATTPPFFSDSASGPNGQMSETGHLQSNPSINTVVSSGVASGAPGLNAIANSSQLQQPTPPCFKTPAGGSMQIKNCAFGTSSTPDQSNAMISSSRLMQAPPGFMEMGNQVRDDEIGDESIFLNWKEFKPDYSWILEPGKLHLGSMEDWLLDDHPL